MSYLLRLVVPDRPGILGAVATALGDGRHRHRVPRRPRARAAAWPSTTSWWSCPRDRLPDSLITAAQAVPGVEVESLRPFAGPLDTHRELELLEALARAAEGTAVKLLAAELPRVFHSGWAVVLRADRGRPWRSRPPPTPRRRSRGSSLPWMPLTAPRLLPSEDDWLPERWREMAIEMMAAPYGGARTAIVLGRSGGPAFRRSELMRLAHLTGIATTVA